MQEIKETWNDALLDHQRRAAIIEKDGLMNWLRFTETCVVFLIEIPDGLRATLFAAAESYNASLKTSDTK